MDHVLHVHSMCVCRAVTRPVLILLPVLGLTWLCGVLVHLSVVVAYVFIALNSFQVHNDMFACTVVSHYHHSGCLDHHAIV